jgi:hypothetical protein
VRANRHPREISLAALHKIPKFWHLTTLKNVHNGARECLFDAQKQWFVYTLVMWLSTVMSFCSATCPTCDHNWNSGLFGESELTKE